MFEIRKYLFILLVLTVSLLITVQAQAEFKHGTFTIYNAGTITAAGSNLSIQYNYDGITSGSPKLLYNPTFGWIGKEFDVYLEYNKSPAWVSISAKNLATDSASTIYAANDGNESLSLTVFGSTAAGTSYGLARADLAKVEASSVFVIGTAHADDIIFGTNDIERVRIKGNSKEIWFPNVLGDNYERAYLKWDADVLKIGTEAGGAGTKRNLYIEAYSYNIDPLPIGWAIDGSVAPGALSTLTSTNSTRYRDFAAAADNDAFFEWQVPYGIDTVANVTFQVEGWITNATAPANTETAKFVLACASYGDSDILSGALGAGVTVTKTFDASYVQYDRFITGYSGAVTISNLAAGELVICNLRRDTTDTYEQPIGVGWIKIKYAKVLQGS